MLKLQIQLIIYSIRNHIEAKTKQRWYYSVLPPDIAKGFTLAEVLITLLIIGIVASITIPALIANTQDAELHTAWKKSYAVIDQATKRIIIDNGGTVTGVFTDHSTMMNSFLSYLNYNKVCYSGQIYGNCWHKNDGSAKYMDGGGISTWNNTAAAILNNSTFLLFIQNDVNCTNIAWGGIAYCGRIFVDVNGFKGPNVVGKDIFGIWILKNTVSPFGVIGDTFDCNNGPGGGWGCAAQYLYQ